MKTLIRRFAYWILKDMIHNLHRTNVRNTELLAHQNVLITQQNEQIQLNYLQIDRLNAELYGRLH